MVSGSPVPQRESHHQPEVINLRTAFATTSASRFPVLASGTLILFALCFVGATAARAAAPAVPEPQPVYFDRLLQDTELADRTLDELGFMRNTIYAHAGRRFKSPDLRRIFAAQPWYHPRGKRVVLTPVDQQNLRVIVRRERMLQHRPLQVACPGSATNLLAPDARQIKQLNAAEASLNWDDDYGGPGNCHRELRITCGPDLDGDGSPEFIVRDDWVVLLNGVDRCSAIRDGNDYWPVTRIFLVRSMAQGLTVVAPLARAVVGDQQSETADAWFVQRPKGGVGIYVTKTAQASDTGCEHGGFRILKLENGKLHEVASGSEPDPNCR
jgi:hypothetical protein